jgi:hypothetical protein
MSHAPDKIQLNDTPEDSPSIVFESQAFRGEKADEMFPELASRFEAVESPYDLWADLWRALQDAYDKVPPDESLIRRVYRYSDWCCEQCTRQLQGIRPQRE